MDLGHLICRFGPLPSSKPNLTRPVFMRQNEISSQSAERRSHVESFPIRVYIPLVLHLRDAGGHRILRGLLLRLLRWPRRKGPVASGIPRDQRQRLVPVLALRPLCTLRLLRKGNQFVENLGISLRESNCFLMNSSVKFRTLQFFDPIPGEVTQINYDDIFFFSGELRIKWFKSVTDEC